MYTYKYAVINRNMFNNKDIINIIKDTIYKFSKEHTLI